MGDETFDLVLEDAQAIDFATILSGLGIHTAMMEDEGHDAAAAMSSDVSMALLEENPEFARYLLLDDEAGDFISAHNVPDGVMEKIDVRFENGEAIDTRDMTKIEVEDDGE